MPNYRRAYVPGGSFFFTLVTDRRAPLFADEPGRAKKRPRKGVRNEWHCRRFFAV